LYQILDRSQLTAAVLKGGGEPPAGDDSQENTSVPLKNFSDMQYSAAGYEPLM
jgi:hypothetical protein